MACSFAADWCVSQIVNPMGEMKGSAITGPVGKVAAELWPVSSQQDFRVVWPGPNPCFSVAYCKQLWCRDVIEVRIEDYFLRLQEAQHGCDVFTASIDSNPRLTCQTIDEHSTPLCALHGDIIIEGHSTQI